MLIRRTLFISIKSSGVPGGFTLFHRRIIFAAKTPKTGPYEQDNFTFPFFTEFLLPLFDIFFRTDRAGANVL